MFRDAPIMLKAFSVDSTLFWGASGKTHRKTLMIQHVDFKGDYSRWFWPEFLFNVALGPTNIDLFKDGFWMFEWTVYKFK